MPSSSPAPRPVKTLEEVVQEVGDYPRQAFEFVHRGLNYTVEQLHGQETDPEADHHVTGRQLCEGLRQFALLQWGMMAKTVLARWNIQSTMDFGWIVFALVDNGMLSKTAHDTLDDFRGVYDFRKAFEADFKIGAAP